MASNADMIQGAFGGLNSDIQRLVPRKASLFQKHLARVLQGEDPLQVAHDYHGEKQVTLGAPQPSMSGMGPQAGEYVMPPSPAAIPDYSQNYKRPDMGPAAGTPFPVQEVASAPGLGAVAAPLRVPTVGSQQAGGLGNVGVEMPRRMSETPVDIETETDFDSLMKALQLRHAQRAQRSQDDILAAIAARGEEARKTEKLKGEQKGALQDDQQDWKGGQGDAERATRIAMLERTLGSRESMGDKRIASKEKVAGLDRQERGREADNRLSLGYKKLESDAKKGGYAAVIFKNLTDAEKSVDQALRKQLSAERRASDIVNGPMAMLPEGKAAKAQAEAEAQAAAAEVAQHMERVKHLREIADATPDDQTTTETKKTSTQVKKPLLETKPQETSPETPPIPSGTVMVRRKSDGKVKQVTPAQAEQILKDPAFEVVRTGK